MKNLKFLLVPVLIVLTYNLKAQENNKSTNKADSMIKVIPVGEGSNSGMLYTVGGKLQTREEILNLLNSNPPSAIELKIAKRNFTWAIISTGGLAASTIAATIEFANNNKNAGVTSAIVNGQATFIYKQHNLTGAYVFTGLATAFLTSAVIHFVKGARHGKQAIKIYNARFQ